MIQDVLFLKLPGSITTLEYPIFPSSYVMPDAYIVHRTEKVKCSRDMAQEIKVDYFEDYDTPNMVSIGDEYYWITGFRNLVYQKEAIVYTLSYAAPTSQLIAHDTINGVWERTPTRLCDYMPNMVNTDALAPMDSVQLPRIIDQVPEAVKQELTARANDIFWVQITVTEKPSTDPDQTNHIGFHSYGFFTAETVDPNVSGSAVDILADPADTTLFYPTTQSILYFIEDLGFVASNITDISVSPRCPYDFVSEIINDHFFIRLKRGGVARTAETPGKTGSVQANVRYYDVTRGQAYPSYDPAPWQKATLDLSDMKTACGQLVIRDEINNLVSNIPMAYVIQGANGPKIEVEAKAVFDFVGLTTHIRIPGHNKEVITINEGKLPWLGTQWEEYRRYSMSLDREAMQNSINRAWAQLGASVLDTAIGAGISAASGNTATAVSAGTGVVSGVIGTLIAEDAARKDQALTEKRMQNSPPSGYNTSYGMIYFVTSIKLGARVELQMPVHLTQAYYEAFTGYFGFPAEGSMSVEITDGYIRGRAYTNNRSGPKFDALNNALGSGFRMIVLTQ